MAAPSFLTIVTGRVKRALAIAVSAGAGDADKVVATGADGKIDASFLPAGVGADNVACPASEALSAGDLINLWNDAGTLKARKADASAVGKEAHGYVTAAVTSGASATVYKEGTVTSQTGLTIGGRVYLSPTTPGRATSTAPTTTGQVVQYLGVALSATTLDFEAEDGIEL